MGDAAVNDAPCATPEAGGAEPPGPGPIAAVRLVAEAVREGVAPAAVLAVGRGGAGQDGAPYEIRAFGHTHPTAAAPPVTEDTVFDLASLTKVVATTPAVLRLIDAGQLALDDPVARYVPAYAEGAKARVTLRHLLTHTAGLPAHEPFHELGASPIGLRAAIAGTPLIADPASTVRYSDVGFMTLGFATSGRWRGRGFSAQNPGGCGCDSGSDRDRVSDRHDGERGLPEHLRTQEPRV